MSINISELIWTVICFFVLLVVLKKLLFDPLVSFMAARDARIQDGLNAGRTAQQQLDAAARARSEAQRMHWPGREIVTRSKRYYPEGKEFAHILGYVAEANERELAADPYLALGDTVGLQGLE